METMTKKLADKIELEILRDAKTGIAGIVMTCKCNGGEKSFCQLFSEGWRLEKSKINLGMEEIVFSIKGIDEVFSFRLHRDEAREIQAILEKPVKTKKLSSIRGIYGFRIEKLF